VKLMGGAGLIRRSDLEEACDVSASENVVLITGASAGIGLACADLLHQQGWKVFGASRRGTSPGTWSPLTMDVDHDAPVEAGIRSITEGQERLGAVVASAGWGLAGAVEDTPIDEAKAQFETNFWGAVRVVQAVLPVMRRQGGGRIVLVGSIGGVIGLPFQAFYSASKFALEGYGESLAYEVAPFGIAVTVVEPGNVKTDFTKSRRTVEPFDGQSAYVAASTKAIGKMARDEADGVPPATIAATVVKVLGSRNPPRRISAGAVDERVGPLAKRLLPYALFERMAKGSLGV
jgi:NAD(P)-dependent dehydrogenase (short-subunit alcohol dehydrogenase family)